MPPLDGNPEQHDYIVIGAGIVGLSTAWQLQQREPQASILLLEKEREIGQHQSGHNSGVIHSGIYYEPGSLKADLCRRGLDATVEFCRSENIPFEQCGKLLVATNLTELERLRALFQRAKDNQLNVEWLEQQQLQQLEPTLSGLSALRIAATGIVDYRQICAAMARRFERYSGSLQLSSEVTAIEESKDHVMLKLGNGRVLQTRFLISCGGLMADRLCELMGLTPKFSIIPFRGEYYRLPPHRQGLVKHLIYPVPDPQLPFLGIHLTRMIDGSITVGPNAALGWKREGYGKFNLNLKDSAAMLAFPGFWKLLAGHIGPGIAELRNAWFKRSYLQQVRKYCPQLTLADLQPYPAGVRAQAVLRDGSLVHDFLFERTPRSLHVCNAPSPAATSAIPIGAYICEQIVTPTPI
ncbi:L-2-hydroxyglutarate oxidase [Halieaceae bacterium IMCC14734]|uniref:L-2-hydroxyglutarate oxidase n=1 Tax=Candidatus Litorirhabdus singularis TaxID=2518993 RepID=A0ABT3TL28_9GAMM|nr:L-2-hydroxyglutarate oxidase [Candidatus Litorirhabdus singularis]MCX2983018.1 L-2-hydroxyglutarate oxidase [Candidatus Litorirhabdus singularis]